MKKKSRKFSALFAIGGGEGGGVGPSVENSTLFLKGSLTDIKTFGAAFAVNKGIFIDVSLLM